MFMLIEDDDSASEALRMMVTQAGGRVRRANSLTSAARHLKLFRPHVMIVDVNLPDGDGLEFIAALPDGKKSTPLVLAMTGDSSADLEGRAAASGAECLLLKPLPKPKEFVSRIKALLEVNSNQTDAAIAATG
jgi:DNA-binding response OmpR family regulator